MKSGEEQLRSNSEVPDPALRHLHWLRFPDDLENDFCREYEAGATIPRATLQVIGILMIAITPFYDMPLLDAPPAFARLSHRLEFGVQIPAVLLALLTTLVPSLRRLSPRTTMVAMLVVSLCLTAQHVIALQMNFSVPQDFAAITVCSVLVAARLRLRELAPYAVLTMVATTGLALHAASDSASLYQEISTTMLFFLILIAAWLIEHSARQSWYRGRLLERLASRDALTGLPNRRYFDLELGELLRRAARERRRVALLILDIDHFKAFNDHYGHPLGDECLRRIGERLRAGMRRPRDFCARVGGEEFAAVWYDADPAYAARLAEQLRQGIDALALPPAPGWGEIVTASAGFAQVLPPESEAELARVAETLISDADDALYRAKRAGRARLVAANAAPLRAA